MALYTCNLTERLLFLFCSHGICLCVYDYCVMTTEKKGCKIRMSRAYCLRKSLLTIKLMCCFVLSSLAHCNSFLVYRLIHSKINKMVKPYKRLQRHDQGNVNNGLPFDAYCLLSCREHTTRHIFCLCRPTVTLLQGQRN